MKRWLSILLAMILVLSLAVPALPISAAETEGSVIDSADGKYVPNQVIVMFKDSAIDTDTMPAVGELAAVGADYGEMMDASSSEDAAYSAADEETAILKKSLGDGFVLEDTLVFDDGANDNGGLAPTGASSDAASSEDFTVALVSSDRYDTATLIEKLGKNNNVAVVEPNYITTPQSYDYSLDDPLNWYDYQTNTPLDSNTGGENVSSRGLDLESYLSTNAGYAWNKLTGDEEEIVVAVIDSGLNVDHEDLKDMLWTNPGDIELEGEHGFNFQDNASDLTDLVGHGTHCAGIIAAQANNGIGLAGVASKVNVKIMMCATASAVYEGDGNGTSYREYAAFNYVLKAKQRGVNIVCTSNSWGSPGVSEVYDRIIDLLGEEGVLTFIAASNDNADMDNRLYRPCSSNSDYKVTVGAANINGARAGFSNYGRSKVDLFAPGVNILSTVGYADYFPNIESREKRSATTEYYGQFDRDTVIEDGRVTPSKADCDDTVKSFGASEFRVQDAYGAEITDSEVVCELAVDTEHTFTKAERPGSLRVTLKNVTPEEQYYLYFPYQKNPDTTGSDNTEFSVYMMRDSSGEYLDASVSFGDVVVEENGSCFMVSRGNSAGIDYAHLGMDTHFNQRSSSQDVIISARHLGDRECGIGCCVTPKVFDLSESGTIQFYIDSIAVSVPDVELSPDDSYQVMSGTSMATPAAAGAYAVMASLYPRQEGQSGSEYALQNRARLMSCVTKTEELSDLCVSGGYLDLSHVDEVNPAITRAECDFENEDIILSGANLNGGYTLSYQRRAEEGSQPVAFPCDGMTADFSEDGKTIVIHNAKRLFSTYTEFTLSDGGSVVAKLCDYLVKGQNRIDLVYQEPYTQTIGNAYYILPNRCMLTDTEGKELYGYETNTGVVSKYDGVQFSDFRGTDLNEAVLQYFKAKGVDDYDLRHCVNVNLQNIRYPINTDNKLYQFAQVTIERAGEDTYEEYYLLCTIDYTADKPEWTFEDTEPFNLMFGLADCSNYGFYGLDGKIYCLGMGRRKSEQTPSPYMYSFDVASGECTREADPPVGLMDPMLCAKDGKLFMTLGHMVPTADMIEQKIVTTVYCYDGESWSENGDIPYIGDRTSGTVNEPGVVVKGCCAAVNEGLLFFNCPTDGGGNVFLYHTDTGETEPLYYSFTGYKADYLSQYSAVETEDGVYYFETSDDGYLTMYNMYLLTADSGVYTPSYQDKGILGDANLDGEVDITDVTVIQRCDVRMTELSQAALKLADVDGDGEVTVLDATFIQRWLINLPAPEGIGEPIR